MRTNTKSLVLAACLLSVPSVVLAQDAKPGEDNKQAPDRAEPTAAEIEQAKGHYLKGAELFEKKDLDGAVKEFKESYRLSRNPLLLYNIGYTLDELGTNDKAVFYYQKFLKDAPAGAQNREVATARVKALSRQVDADSLFAGGEEKPTAEAVKTRGTDGAAVEAFQHNAVDEIPPGKPLDVTAFVPDGVNWQVQLFFRGAGESKFSSVEMRPRYNELVGRIPASKTVGVSMIQYYIEVKDKSGKIVDRSGRSTSPHLVLIEKSAKPRFYPDLTDDRSWETKEGGVGQTGQPTGDGGWTDVTSNRFRYAKWGATGTAVGMLALSATFYFIASDSASSLEGEAFSSSNEDCAGAGGPPCRSFSNKQKDLESRGERFELMSKVTFGLGLVAGAAAGAAWYWEIKKGGESSSDVAAVPVVGKDYVGAAAALRF